MSIIPFNNSQINIDAAARAMQKQGILPNTRKADYLYGITQEIKPYISADEFQKECGSESPALKTLPQWKQDFIKQSGWFVDLKKTGRKSTDIGKVLSEYSARQARTMGIDEAAFLDSFCAIDKACNLEKSSLKNMGPIKEVGTLIVDLDTGVDISGIKKIGNLFINGNYDATADEAKALLRKLNFNPKQLLARTPWFNAKPLI